MSLKSEKTRKRFGLKSSKENEYKLKECKDLRIKAKYSLIELYSIAKTNRIEVNDSLFCVGKQLNVNSNEDKVKANFFRDKRSDANAIDAHKNNTKSATKDAHELNSSINIYQNDENKLNLNEKSGCHANDDINSSTKSDDKSFSCRDVKTHQMSVFCDNNTFNVNENACSDDENDVVVVGFVIHEDVYNEKKNDVIFIDENKVPENRKESVSHKNATHSNTKNDVTKTHKRKYEQHIDKNDTQNTLDSRSKTIKRRKLNKEQIIAYSAADKTLSDNNVGEEQMKMSAELKKSPVSLQNDLKLKVNVVTNDINDNEDAKSVPKNAVKSRRKSLKYGKNNGIRIKLSENTKRKKLSKEQNTSNENNSVLNESHDDKKEAKKMTKNEQKSIQYEVEKIVDCALNDKGKHLYLVQWKGYSSKTWESCKNVAQCDLLLNEFYKSLTDKFIKNSFEEFDCFDNCLKLLSSPEYTDVALLLKLNNMSLSQFDYSEKCLTSLKKNIKSQFILLHEKLKKRTNSNRVEARKLIYKMCKKLNINKFFDSSTTNFIQYFNERKKLMKELKIYEDFLNAQHSNVPIIVENNVDLSRPPTFIYITESFSETQLNENRNHLKSSEMGFSFDPNADKENDANSLNPCCSQNEIKYKLAVFKTENGSREWGLRTLEMIPKDSFIIEFAAKITRIPGNNTKCQAFQLNEGTETDGENSQNVSTKDFTNTYIIDVHKYSNISRFINHSYTPNMISTFTPSDADHDFPRISLVSCREINQHEELTCNFGDEVIPVQRLIP